MRRGVVSLSRMKASVSRAGLKRRVEVVSAGFVRCVVGRADRMIWTRVSWMSNFSAVELVFRHCRRAMRPFRTSNSVPTLAVVIKPHSKGSSELDCRARQRMKTKYDTLDVKYKAVRSRS